MEQIQAWKYPHNRFQDLETHSTCVYYSGVFVLHASPLSTLPANRAGGSVSTFSALALSTHPS